MPKIVGQYDPARTGDPAWEVVQENDGPAIRVTVQGNGEAFEVVGGGWLFGTISAKSKGAKGDGVTNDRVAIQAALDSGAKTVFLPAGTYLINGDLIVPSGVTLYADRSTAVLQNAHLRIEGSAGSEIPITVAMARGTTTVTLSSTTGLVAGGWVRLVSSINSNSHDAGVDQLGGRTADNSFLSEFARIKSVDTSTQITLEGGVLWPYAITAGADSAARTTSTVIPITFNDRARVEGVRFSGRFSSNAEVVGLSLARGARLVNCEIDTNGAACYAARMSYSLDSHFEGGRYIGNPAASTSNEITVVFRSSTDCTIRNGARVEYGYQGVDVTYGVTDTTLWGGPCISCGADTVSARGQLLDAFTDHPGVYRTRFVDTSAYGAVRGIRLRGRGSRVIRGGVSGHTTNGIIGILVEGGFTAGWSVEGCDVDGFSVGIAFTSDESVSTSRPVVHGSASGRVVNNNLRGCVTGIEGVSPSTVNALIHSVQVEGNNLRDISSNPIYVSAYCNGVEVGDNTIHGVTAGNAGVTYEANIKRLWIGRNNIFSVDAAGFAVKGPGIASFITDTTTFPAGNAEAFLFIDAQVTDAATAFSSVIRDATAFVNSKPAGWSGFVSSISTQIPADADLERNSIALYLDASNNVQAKFKNATGTVFTKLVA